jgi:hypothetical protein
MKGGFMAFNNNSKDKPQAIVVSIDNVDLNTTSALLNDDNDIVNDNIDTNSRITFDNEVYKNLPLLLKATCDIIHEKSEKDLFLAGALGVISGMLPNVKGYYFDEEVESNLYIYILGNYGTGKAGLKKARILAEPIHSKKLQNYKDLKKINEIQKCESKSRSKENKEEKIREELPIPNFKHFIPANSSNPAMKKLLNDNNGRGTIFETEADTLFNIFKKEYGNYSDDLRKAFHHENISSFRKTNNEDIEISSPYLSVVLSSTPDQLLSLIPNAENGLFSRFCYFLTLGDPSFKNPWKKGLSSVKQRLIEISKRYLNIYEQLENLEEPIWFRLTENQQVIFCNVFQEWKNIIREFISEDLDGTVNRLGLICFRICMILSAVRHLENEYTSNKINCSDQDFENALRIIEVFKCHAIEVFKILPKPGSLKNNAIDKKLTEAENRIRCQELYNNGKGLSLREISIIVFGSESQKSTVHRYVNGK